MIALMAFLSSSILCLGQESQVADKEKASSSLDLPDSTVGLPGEGPLRQYDWFRNLWNAKRSEWAKSAASDQSALVLLGDSITQGWPNLETHFPNVKIANRGISGDTTRGMLIRLKEDVLAIHPKGVVMLMGTNDLEENGEPETIAKNIIAILAELKKHDSNMPIVFCLIFPSSETKSRPTQKIQEANKLVVEAVKGDAQITVIDTFALFADEHGDAKPDLFPDLLHLNPAGYERWAAALRPILATLGFLETEEDPFKVEPGFVSLFNGKDLTGWGFRAKEGESLTESFDGKRQTPDGRYVALHGRLVVTTPPEGRRIQQLWTTKTFSKNFVLKMEFRATPNADSGIFVRKPQLQCRDYPLAGPYKELTKYRLQDWNEMEIHVTGNVARCTCNGELLEAAMALPASGPIGLEGDRGQMEYRRIRIRELDR